MEKLEQSVFDDTEKINEKTIGITMTTSSQEQAVAAWIDSLNQLRINELLEKLKVQDINREAALNELQNIKDFISKPMHILGGPLSKHGEVAEHMQVGISNARRIIEGLQPEYSFEGVARTAPEDYLKNGQAVQSKFYTGEKGKQTFCAIKKHLEKYPDFLNNGGSYEIPKDQYEAICKVLDAPSSQRSRTEDTLVKNIKEWEELKGITFNDKVKSTTIDFEESRLYKAPEVIEKENKAILEKDQSKREIAHEASKPTWHEGRKVTLVSAGIEGGVSFCMAMHKKLKSGKKLHTFTLEDWKDVGIDTSKGTTKGAIRGGAVYGMTNFTATPAAVASSFVTATLGVSALAHQLYTGKITTEEFIVNSQVVCLEVTISTVSSLLGQVVIPIPMLGAIIGNAMGMFLYGIGKNNLAKQEQDLILHFTTELELLNMQLDKKYAELVEKLKKEFKKYSSILALAFDEDVNTAFVGSIEFARYVGVAEHKILTDNVEIDDFFTN